MELNWDAQYDKDRWAEESAVIGGQLYLRNSPYKQQYRVRFILPGRSLNAEYYLESTGSAMKHAVEVYFPGTTGYPPSSNRQTIGYSIETETADGYRNASLRLGFLYYFCEIRGVQNFDSSHSLTQVDMRTDVSNPGVDVKVMGFRHESTTMTPSTVFPYLEDSQVQKNVLTVYQATENSDESHNVEHEIVLISKFETLNGDQQGTVEFIYSPDIQEHLIFEYSTGTQLSEPLHQDGEDVRTTDELVHYYNASVRHPVSTTNLNLVANFKSTPHVISLNAHLEDHFNSSRFFDLAAGIQKDERQLDVQMRTAMHSLAVSGNLTRPSDSVYQLNWETVLNDIDTSSLTAQYNPHRPELLINTVSGGIEFNMYGGMPSNREVMLRSSRNIHGRTINDGYFNLKLNTTSLLSSRLYWRADSAIELRNHGLNFITNVLATRHAITGDVIEMLTDNNLLPSIWDAPVFQEVSLKRE